MASKHNKFSRPRTFVDKMGTPQDAINYQRFYSNLLPKISDCIKTKYQHLTTAQKQKGLFEQIAIVAAEALWFDNHNPCYKITNEVIEQIKDVKLPENIDFDFMPFDSFMVVFSEKTPLKIDCDNLPKTSIQGIMVTRFNGMIIFALYTKQGTSASIYNDKEPLFPQIFADTLYDDDFVEIIETALKIGLLSSNEILTEQEGISLVCKPKHKEPNSRVITEFKCSDYVRYIKPIWENMINSFGKTTRELHYQFTRTGHWRRFRDELGNVINKVWVNQALVRPDLPRKAELMAI